jgi:(p)ppGpp synthase/HD superfamily hydrolase
MEQPYFNLTPSPGQQPYNLTFLSKAELEERLRDRIELEHINRIISAYELGESVHETQKRNDGTPYFYHTSRVCKILIDELRCFDPDLLCASLVHDVLEDSQDINATVLEYNFGATVAFIVQTLTKDLERQKLMPDLVDLEHVEALRRASEDCLLIRLVARLDNFRCLEFNLKRNPIIYVNNTSERYMPLAERIKWNTHLQYVLRELKKERNKFIG